MNESVLKEDKNTDLISGNVLAGFAGAGADCLTLLDRLKRN